MIITDNDNNNREHYLKKLRLGDEEDVTRIFLDDTEKHRQEGTGQPSFKKDHAQDHVLKTMEDTAGKIFKGNRFTKFVHGKKSRHVHSKSPVRVMNKKVSKKNPFKSSAKLRDLKTKGGKMTHFRKHYLKPKSSSKIKTSKGKHNSTRKNSTPSAEAFKGTKAGRISNKHPASKTLTTKKYISERHEKLKNTLKREDSKGRTKKPHKNLTQGLNVTLKMASKLASTLSTSSVSVGSELGKSKNATRALGLISQLIAEIQKNPLVTKIAAEALRNPDIGKLFGIDFSKDARENIKKKLSPASSIKHQGKDLTNGTRIDGAEPKMDTVIAERSNASSVTSVNETSYHFQTAKQGTIKSNKHKHIQFFKIIKDNQEDYKSDVSGSGMEGSGSLGSGYYFDGIGSGSSELSQVFKNRISRCGDSTNCTGAEDGESSLSVLNKSAKELKGENDEYDIFDEDEEESPYSDSTSDGENPAGNDEDSDDLIPEFGFNLNSIDENNSDLCNFSLDSSNASLFVQKAHCPENSTVEKRADERDKEDKNLAHYLAVGKLKSASGDNSMDNNDDQDGSSSKDKLGGEQDDSDVKYDSKDLEVLQEALEDQLSRLSKDPASQKSNAEILARVRDDIKRGDIDDLELLEAQITGGKTEITRIARSRTPEDEEFDDTDDDNADESFGGFDGEDEDLERRRISRQVDKGKLSKTYYVDPDKYGKDNSGILESWTLILYGTK